MVDSGGGQSTERFRCINKVTYFKEIYGKSKHCFKSLLLRPQRTVKLEYQYGGDELQNLIAEIT